MNFMSMSKQDLECNHDVDDHNEDDHDAGVVRKRMMAKVVRKRMMMVRKRMMGKVEEKVSPRSAFVSSVIPQSNYHLI